MYRVIHSYSITICTLSKSIAVNVPFAHRSDVVNVDTLIWSLLINVTIAIQLCTLYTLSTLPAETRCPTSQKL